MGILLLLYTVTLTGQSFRFRETVKRGFFEFETPAMKGIIRADGKVQGVAELIDKETGRNLARPLLPGFLSLYRIFSRGMRFRDPRTAPLKSLLRKGGEILSLQWERLEEWPFELSCTFRIPGSRTLELTVEFTAEKDLQDFDLFVSNYVALGFKHFLFLKRTLHLGGKQQYDLFEPRATPFYKGCYLAFPRDHQAAKLFFDGRWLKPPHPVHWAIARHYALPLVGSREEKTGLSVIIMAVRKECFALETTYAQEGRPDSVAGHNSIYLSLFGKTLRQGSTARMHLALHITKLKSPAGAIDLWRLWRRSVVGAEKRP